MAALISFWYLELDDDLVGEDAVGNEVGFVDASVSSDDGIGLDSRAAKPRCMSLLLDTRTRSDIGRTKWIRNIGHVEGRDEGSTPLDLGRGLPF